MRRVSIADLIASPQEIGRFRKLLASGRLAAIPTETFYGLAVDPRNPGGLQRIFDAKGREEGKPVPVVFATRDQLEELGVAASDDLLGRYLDIWPAPLTVVLPLTRPIAASRGRPNLALRIPAYPGLVCLLGAVGPVTATSANRSGEEPLTDPNEVARIFEGSVELLVDGGRTPGGRPSTLLDATVDPPLVLRSGAFSWPVR